MALVWVRCWRAASNHHPHWTGGICARNGGGNVSEGSGQGNVVWVTVEGPSISSLPLVSTTPLICHDVLGPPSWTEFLNTWCEVQRCLGGARCVTGAPATHPLLLLLLRLCHSYIPSMSSYCSTRQPRYTLRNIFGTDGAISWMPRMGVPSLLLSKSLVTSMLLKAV